ncbi:phosphoglycerate mutase family protein [Rhizodiscina lignyota]|uniref:Phosphoglycerate mutase family protein n=1 Tax=Rhizodiscina lignyota TaxID=1504668 RepID=A0A9P4M5N1_9PEZI|nr:phosphoglycerate mutase family protein [Rhizodiscina lignyota]
MTAPTLHLVRHAQGFHNLTVENHHMPDPLLTEYGKEQCRILHDSFPDVDSIDLIVASPLKRTVYTALISFRDIIARKNLTVIALPEAQETSDMPCDTGSHIDELEKEFQGQPVDFGLVAARPDWNSKKGDWAPWADPMTVRARKARQWLRERKEKNIVMVTHGGFLHYFTEDFDGYDTFNGEKFQQKLESESDVDERILIWMSEYPGTGWANTEYRAYTYDLKSGSNASILETSESRRRRRGDEKPLTEAEQRNLKMSATKAWEDVGYVKAEPTYSIQSKLRAAKQDRDWVGGFGV